MLFQSHQHQQNLSKVENSLKAEVKILQSHVRQYKTMSDPMREKKQLHKVISNQVSDVGLASKMRVMQWSFRFCVT